MSIMNKWDNKNGTVRVISQINEQSFYIVLVITSIDIFYELFRLGKIGKV